MKDKNLNTQMSLEDYRKKVLEWLDNWYPKRTEYNRQLLEDWSEELEELYNENWTAQQAAGGINSELL